jgi:homocysteine S-methyltransferase
MNPSDRSFSIEEMKHASIFREHSVTILDGGLGTTLEDEYAVQFSPKTPLWSSHLLISSPSTIRHVHKAFVDAGADIVLTATYQASFDGFAKTRASSESISRQNAVNYMLSAVPLARSSFGSGPGVVALSLGAYGATMTPSTEYSGDYGPLTLNDLETFHHDRLNVFLSQVDTWDEINLLAFETLPRLDEVQAVRRIASSLPQDLQKPYWISCVFPGTDSRLPDGSAISDIVKACLLGNGGSTPFAIGINCTKVHKLPQLIEHFEHAIIAAEVAFPSLVIYPDGAGGRVYDTQLQKWVDSPADQEAGQYGWDEAVFRLVQDVQSRARWFSIIVGGCCKVSPLNIRKLRSRIAVRQQSTLL